MRRGRKFRGKSQAAMEYLASYSWMILIVVVVLVVLFTFGVFSSSGPFTPRAAPGSCQIARSGLSPALSGNCNGELPEYAAQFNGAAYVTTPFYTSNMPAITVTAWFNLNSVSAGHNPRVVANGNTLAAGDYHGVELAVNNGGTSGFFAVGNGVTENSITWNTPLASGTWYFYAGTYSQSSGTVTVYINGNAMGTGSYAGLVNGVLPVAMGYDPAYSGDYLAGYISNVQIYNASLSAGDMKSLYLEGIGGAPIDTLYLVGWWPLNGNADDYSGLVYNANTVGVDYTNSWTKGYTAP